MSLLRVPVTLLLAASLICAQQPAPTGAARPAPERQDNTIRVDVQRVNMLFTVSDKRGRFVTDLAKEDFEIFESKKQQQITEFVAESDLPLRLAILIDTSNSVRDRFRFLQEAATQFVQSVIRPDVDKAVIVSFDSAPQLVADLTGDTEKLTKAIRDMRPGGGTSMYDAVFFASKDKLGQDQPQDRFRRAMVILSDGDDSASRYSRDQALEMAQKTDVTIYAISNNITKDNNPGDKVLKYLSEETGGLTFFPFKASDLAQSFENIANELRKQYSILYRPEPYLADGLFHPVSIRVKGRKDLVVRARKGYYARRGS